MLKKILMGAGGLFIGLLLAFLFLTLKLRWQLDGHKDPSTKLINDFMTCFYQGNIDECSPKYVTPKYASSFSPERLKSFSAMIKKELGLRGNALPIDESWNLTESFNTSGNVRVITVTMRAYYPLDPNATESFTLEERDGAYTVRAFRINSDKAMH